MPRGKYPVGLQPRPPRFTITVTDPLIAKAKAANSHQCAIAQSVGMSVEGASHIMVDTATIRFTVGESRFYYYTPASVQRFVLDFDGGKKVEPFRFQLRDGVVHQVARRPGVGGRPKGSKASKAPGHVPSHAGRRTYGARSMTPKTIAAASNRVVSHA
jgi:hypothetical protein